MKIARTLTIFDIVSVPTVLVCNGQDLVGFFVRTRASRIALLALVWAVLDYRSNALGIELPQTDGDFLKKRPNIAHF